MAEVAVKALCPDCGQKVNLGTEPRIGQIVTCRRCKEDSVVINLDPPELNWEYSVPQDEWSMIDWGLPGTWSFPRGIWWYS